jgi:AcrR family transcriptional regulator
VVRRPATVRHHADRAAGTGHAGQAARPSARTGRTAPGSDPDPDPDDGVDGTAPNGDHDRPAGAGGGASGPAGRRTEILAVAARLFSTRGFHGTSMRDIAAALHIRAPSLYKHVVGKDELLAAVAGRYLDAFLPELAAAAAADGDAARRLGLMIRTSVDVGRRYLPEFLALSNDWNHIRATPGLADLAARTRAGEALWLAVLRDGAADGSLRADLDPRPAYRLLVSAVAGMVDDRYDDIDDGPPERRAAAAVAVLVQGLRPPPPNEAGGGP